MTVSPSEAPAPRPDPGAGPERVAPRPDLLVILSATPGSASLVRHRARDWLDRVGWPAEAAEDAVMAVNEAVANVIDHAYRDDVRPGDVRVYAWPIDAPAGRRIVVTVTDTGRWRPAPTDPGHRGRGLQMMRACMDSVLIQPASAGTTIVMTATLADGDDAISGRATATS
jgi:anti-sigma regulatory factor (Ser/Thr protein kinase)